MRVPLVRRLLDYPRSSACICGFRVMDRAIPPSSPRTPGAPSIPDHELLRPIASGSYGEVWLARNVVGTMRAVKIVRRDRHVAAQSFDREFKGLQKFEPVSRSHVGLVDILTLGLLPDGAGFYYVMELADQAEPGPNTVAADVRRLTSAPSTAQTIASDEKSEPPHVGCYSAKTLRADLKSRGALPADDVIALGLRLTAALAHLHENGLVHRDVKPSNILFIGGEPKLADAGLVAAVDDARSLVGTAGYIAPEGPGTPQADLYALGKVLYEAAFGKDRQEFPALPADVASRPDHARLLEVNAILLKASAADRRERYQSAEQMRDDLELLQRGQSVKRRRTLHRAWAVSKKAGLAGVLFALAAILVLRFVRDGAEYYPESPIGEVNVFVDQGNHFLKSGTSEGIRIAMDWYRKAIKRDPNFIPAHWGLFGTYVYQDGMHHDGDAPADVRKEIHIVAKKMMEIDPHCAESLSASAGVKWSDWEIPEALEQARLATQARVHCKDGRAWAHGGYGFLLERTGNL